MAFRFVQRPEYLVPGDRLLFREGRTKGLGIVKSVGYDPSNPLNPEGHQEETAQNGDKGDKTATAPLPSAAISTASAS